MRGAERGILVRCGLWRMITHILARARIHITHTVRLLTDLFITRFGGRPTSLGTQHVWKYRDEIFNLSTVFGLCTEWFITQYGQYHLLLSLETREYRDGCRHLFSCLIRTKFSPVIVSVCSSFWKCERRHNNNQIQNETFYSWFSGFPFKWICISFKRSRRRSNKNT